MTDSSMHSVGRSPHSVSSSDPASAPAQNAATGDRPQSHLIAVIGDVHDQWQPQDGEALAGLGVDLALFVGDFGNESVEVVRAIASLDLPKAIILGNHDAWYSATAWGREKCPYDRRVEDRVQQQLDLLGDAHVGFGVLDMESLGLSVVGGRPFTWGGSEWINKTFYRERYGVKSFNESTAKIQAAVQQATYDTVIFIGHCGPTGLGDRAEDPCGRDWSPVGGDYGDPDLERAIAQAKADGKRVPLVTFGHMHHSLRHRKDRIRNRTVVSEDRTLYLNAARVPRIVEKAGEAMRTFSLVRLNDGMVQTAAQVWVNGNGEIRDEEVLYDRWRSPHSMTLSVY